MKRTVLVVEDIDICRDALEVALMRLKDVDVQVVPTAEQALTRLRNGHISALLTDLNLPAMDGFQLIEAVRSMPQYSALPILVLSGDSDPDTPARLASLGANAYFPKPYSPAEVRALLEQLIDAS
ncbi:MAG: response regulator [Bryobacteraceae bacterium]